MLCFVFRYPSFTFNEIYLSWFNKLCEDTFRRVVVSKIIHTYIYCIFGIIPSSREYVLEKINFTEVESFQFAIISHLCISLSHDVWAESNKRRWKDLWSPWTSSQWAVGRIFIRQKAFSLTAVNSFVSYDSGLEVICWMCCCFYKRDDIDHLKISVQANNCQICCYLFAISLCGTF